MVHREGKGHSPTTDFARWLSNQLPSLEISLDIPRSSRVSKGIKERVTGVESVLALYRWSSTWGAEGRTWPAEDWPTTKRSLSELRRRLSKAICSESDCEALRVCRQIIEWGGDRNERVGAVPFLTNKADSGELVSYIATSKSAFDLSLSTKEALGAIGRMNSMLTKVHALAASDGLPIYDSRVAAAIATLAEIFRRNELGPDTSLPPEIAFPSVGGSQERRTVVHFDPAAVGPGALLYSGVETTLRWSDAMVRLGRLLHSTLQLNPRLFSSEGAIAERAQALEASLFMVGYDVAALRGDA